MPFEAILFDPATKASSRVSVQTFGSSLEVVRGATGESLRVDPSRCELTAGGWDHQSILISWPGALGTFALSSTDPLAASELARIAPFQPALAAALKSGGRARRHERMGLAVVALVTLLPALVLLSLFAFRNQIVDAVLKKIPVSVDQEIGKMFEAEILRSKAVVAENEATRAIGVIVDRLKQANSPRGFEFRVSVQRNTEVNAFAAPGGLIVVYTGLINEAGSAEEVAGVVAHEMAHATRRHSMRQLIYGAGLLPLMGLVIGQPDTASLVQNLGQLSELRFSRSQEEDADRGGFDSLVSAGIPTEGMARFFDRLAQAEGAPPSFLSTHPSSAGRADAVRERGRGVDAANARPLPIDWDAVKASIR
ncbi:MAG: M48 family metallopeptidase [Vicinamibacteria bacterium]|nr:M48 family metallopeptidase [Vicinamibacteria bacterium]